MSIGTDSGEVKSDNNGEIDVNNIDIDDVNNNRSDVVRTDSTTSNTHNSNSNNSTNNSKNASSTSNAKNADNGESNPIPHRHYLEIDSTVRHIITPSSSSKVNGKKRTFNADDITEIESTEGSENTKKVRLSGDGNDEMEGEKINEVSGKKHLEEGQDVVAKRADRAEGAEGAENERHEEDNDEDEGEEDDEDEEEDEEEFLRAMKEFEGKDIEALQAYITAQES